YLLLSSTQAVVLRSVSATAIYSAALIVLAIWASGGVRHLKTSTFFSCRNSTRKILAERTAAWSTSQAEQDSPTSCSFSCSLTSTVADHHSRSEDELGPCVMLRTLHC